MSHKRNGDLRQSVSSELSSQSLSPSQRQSLSAQRPFLHLNSLGSQGDGVPAKKARGWLGIMLLSGTVCMYRAALLTTSKLVASIWAVPLTVTDIVTRYTLSSLTCSLIHSAGSRLAGGTHYLLGCINCGGRGCDDRNNRPYWVWHNSFIRPMQRCTQVLITVPHIKQPLLQHITDHVKLPTSHNEATHHNWAHHSCLCSLVGCHTGIPLGYMSHHHTCAHLACRVAHWGLLLEMQRGSRGRGMLKDQRHARVDYGTAKKLPNVILKHN